MAFRLGTAGKSFIPAAIALLFASGCYTQFASLNYSPQVQSRPQAGANEGIIVEIDSMGDTVRTRALPMHDSVTEQAAMPATPGQTCIWTRDYTGAPVLRCYDDFYNPDYYWYNDYPWWYRYDETYGIGRGNHSYGGNGRGSGGGAHSTQGTTSSGTSTRQLLDRSYGVPSSQSSRPVESAPGSLPKQNDFQSQQSAPPAAGSSEQTQPSYQPPSQQNQPAPSNSNQNDQSREKLRNPRGL